MDDAAVYLIPIGGERFELYTEPAEESADEALPEGAVAGTLHRWRERWRRAVDAAQHPPQQRAADGRLGRARRWLVCKIAASIEEQRTLWSLRRATSASFVYPADLTEATAAGIRGRLLADARTHHRWWLVANASGVAATAILILLPGPNVIGYYFLFRTVGHYLSWRGAGQALDRITWRPRSEDAAAIRVLYTRR